MNSKTAKLLRKAGTNDDSSIKGKYLALNSKQRAKFKRALERLVKGGLE